VRHASPLRFTILDRYMLTELAGPAGFGLAIFTMIFAANQLLNLGRLVSNEHAPLWAAIAVFLWELPAEIVLVIPMALLLGTLLAMQRLSGESELIAMNAGGIGFLRIVAPLLAAGFAVSIVTLILQENLVPFANSQVTAIENQALSRVSPFGRDLTVKLPLPGGGRQVTIATSFDPKSSALLHVTLIQYDRNNQPTQIVFADRAEFAAEKWVLYDSSVYHFTSDGSSISEPHVARQEVEIGENPTDIVKRIGNNDPQSMSRSQIAEIVRSGQLTETEMRNYVTTYQEKLARPFACFVLVLIAIPYGLRSARGGGGMGIGFGLSILIIFVYYVVMVICSYVGEAFLPLAWLWAWMPNLIFTALGVRRLRRAALV
jgi:lipopolysaccharide export system permease protein